MVETKTKVIDGAEIAVTPFFARRGLAMQARLLKIAGPGLAPLLEKGADAEIDFTAVIMALTARLDEQEVVKYIEDLLAGTRYNGIELTGVNIDAQFSCNYWQLFKVIGFALEVNFGGFFAAIGKAIPKQDETPKTIRRVLRND